MGRKRWRERGWERLEGIRDLEEEGAKAGRMEWKGNGRE
jgi:hypothetical protein